MSANVFRPKPAPCITATRSIARSTARPRRRKRAPWSTKASKSPRCRRCRKTGTEAKHRMNREAILSSLIRFDASVGELKAALGSLAWDAKPAVTLERPDIVAVLERYVTAEIDASA